jgi:hypothetical protein
MTTFLQSYKWSGEELTDAAPLVLLFSSELAGEGIGTIESESCQHLRSDLKRIPVGKVEKKSLVEAVMVAPSSEHCWSQRFLL